MRSHPYSVVAKRRKTTGGSLGDLAQIKVVAREPSALKKTHPMRLGRLSEAKAAANKNPPAWRGIGILELRQQARAAPAV